MSYVKHDFNEGDILHASQLEEMDDQIAVNEKRADDAVSAIVSGKAFDISWLEKGSLEQGADNTYRKDCRCRTIGSPISFPYPLIISIIEDSTGVYVHCFNDGVYDSTITLTSGSVTIPANTFFRLCVEGARGQSTRLMSIEEIYAKIEIASGWTNMDVLASSYTNLNEHVWKLDKEMNGFVFDTSIMVKGALVSGADGTWRKKCRCRTGNNADGPLTFEYPLVITILETDTAVTVCRYVEGVWDETPETIRTVGSSITIEANTEFRFFVDGRGTKSTIDMTIEEILAKVNIEFGIITINGISERVDALETELSEVISAQVPAYYFENDYLPEKCLAAQKAASVNGISFGFITDVHVIDSQCHSMAVARYIADNTSALPFMICGGDVCQTSSAHDPGDELYWQGMQWQKMQAQYGKERIYSCRGNHDYLAHYSTNLPHNACRSFVMDSGPKDVHISYPGALSYYFDIPSMSTRVIVLDQYDCSSQSAFDGYVYLSKTQYRWLMNEALNVTNTKIIVVVHQPLNYEKISVDDPDDYKLSLNYLKGILTALYCHGKYCDTAPGDLEINVDYTQSTNELICVLSGHKHRDYVGTLGLPEEIDGEPTGISSCGDVPKLLTIGTTSDCIDGRYSAAQGRVAGTITEGAFDIISIDYDNKTIHCERIGAGSNRTLTYGDD